MVRYGKPGILDQLGASHAVIEASAGTGKTYTFEHLVIQLILEGIPLDQILVVTFTHKATLELIARVRAKLAELLALQADQVGEGQPWWDLDETAMERLRQALMGFDRATISTIHGFCQQVLQDAAFEGGRLFRQKLVAKEEAFDQAFTHLLRTRFATEHRELLEVALRVLGGPSGLRELLGEALKEADNLDLPPLDARTSLERFPVALAQAFLRKDPDIYSKFPESAKAISSRLEELLEKRERVLASGQYADFWSDEPWFKKKLFEYLPAICRPGLTGDAARLADGVRGLANFQGLVVRTFLPLLRETLAQQKQEEGCFDFDDMITLVAETLDGPRGEALAQRLRERFRVALIDEFQDTDAQQWRIFQRLFLDSPEHRLFLVGDPKQAIYGFRSGDLPTYVSALEAVGARTHAAPHQLDKNFRSTASVIQAYNRIFEADGETAFFSGANVPHYHQPVQCGKPALRLVDEAGEALPAIRCVEVRAGKGRAPQQEAAQALAWAIRDTLERGRFQAPGRSERLAPEDVFVLTRSLKEGRVMAQALAQVGLPASLYRQNGLFEGPEAKACRDILLAIESPMDESRRAKALLGPFFGLSFAEVERTRELPEGHPILERLFAWRELALQGRFGEFFNGLVCESGLSQRLLFLEDSQRGLTNLLHILELLQQEALSEHCTLRDLALRAQRWIDGVARPAVEEGDTQRLERAHGAVQILTMHKSKGLQAPVVALFGGLGRGKAAVLSRYHVGGTGARRAWIGPLKTAPAEVQAWIEEEAREEGERLAYVALTRAEAQLILPRFVSGEDAPGSQSNFDAEGHPKGLYGVVNRRLRHLVKGEVVSPGFEHLQAPSMDVEALPQVPASWVPEQPPALARPDFEALRCQGRPTWIFSFTGLHKGLARLEGGSHDSHALALDLEDVKESAPSRVPGGKKLGTQVHRFLEEVEPASFQGRSLDEWLAAPEIQALAEVCLPVTELGREGQGGALRWIHHAWTRPMDLPNGSRASLLEAEACLRELDFLTPFPEREDLLTGSIDVLFKSGGRAFVLDWKTNALPAFDAVSLDAVVQSDYLLQVKIYTLTACRFLGIQDEDAYEANFGGVVYVFLRGLPEGGLWTLRPDWDTLRTWEQELAALQPERLIPAFAGGVHA